MSLGRFVKMLITLLPLLVFTSCGDGSGAGSTGSISGIAADGYLQNASVCLDLDNSGHCDENEPRAITGEGGAFILDVGAYSADDYPVVVEVVGATVDEDSNQPVGASYTLRAPAGRYAFVTPLTTLVQTKIDQNPALDAEAAAQIVGLQLNVEDPDKLYADYVAGASDGELDGLHQGARIIANAFGEIREMLSSNDVTSGLEDEYELRAVQVVTGKLLLGKLDQVAVAVQEGGGVVDPLAEVMADANLVQAGEFNKVAGQIRAFDNSAVVGAYSALSGKTLYSFNEGGDDGGVTIVFFDRLAVGADAAVSSDADLREMADFSDLTSPSETDTAPFAVQNGQMIFSPGEGIFTENHLTTAVAVDLAGLTFRLADLAQVKMQDTVLRAKEVTFQAGDVMYKVNGVYFPTDVAAAAKALYDDLAEPDDEGHPSAYLNGRTLAQLVAYTHNKTFPFSDHGVVLGPKTYLKNFQPSIEDPARGTLVGINQADGSDTITVGTYRISELSDGSGRACIIMNLYGFAEVNGVWDHVLIVNDAEDNHDFEQILIADTAQSKSAETLYFNESAMEKIFNLIDGSITYP